MFPTTGDIILAPFEDAGLYEEQKGRAAFWSDNSFMGIDLTPLHEQSMKEVFAMPVVGYFHPSILLSTDRASKVFDFRTCSVEDLKNFAMPFNFTISRAGVVHGIAGWFDCDFMGTQNVVPLKTGPEAPGTHWYQCRLLFSSPLGVNAGQRVSGTVTFAANDSFSYDVVMVACVEGTSGPEVKTEQTV